MLFSELELLLTALDNDVENYVKKNSIDNTVFKSGKNIDRKKYPYLSINNINYINLTTNDNSLINNNVYIANYIDTKTSKLLQEYVIKIQQSREHRLRSNFDLVSLEKKYISSQTNRYKLCFQKNNRIF